MGWWRVELLEPDRHLRLAAEMKLPGRAYWIALYPVRQLVFGGMLRGIARAAAQETSSRG